MPKIEKPPPPGIFDHLIRRPGGAWSKRFKTRILAGHGKYLQRSCHRSVTPPEFPEPLAAAILSHPSPGRTSPPHAIVKGRIESVAPSHSETRVPGQRRTKGEPLRSYKTARWPLPRLGRTKTPNRAQSNPRNCGPKPKFGGIAPAQKGMGALATRTKDRSAIWRTKGEPLRSYKTARWPPTRSGRTKTPNRAQQIRESARRPITPPRSPRTH